MTKIQMTKTKDMLYPEDKLVSMFGDLTHSYFGFVSDFEFIDSTQTLDPQSPL